MKTTIRILFILAISFSCSQATSEEASRPVEWIGEWKAEWETPEESYPDLEDIELYMDGKFVFTDDSLTVTVNGYPGCIFSVDTLSHTQSWEVSNDTLVTLNDPKTPGMTYKIKTFSNERIELQLMEDIFVTLSK